MQTQKMSLATIQGKMSRNEMKYIMGGVSDDGCKGITQCPKDNEGQSCGSIEASIETGSCVCTKTSDGYYCS